MSYPATKIRRKILRQCREAVRDFGPTGMVMLFVGIEGTEEWLDAGRPRRWEILPDVFLEGCILMRSGEVSGYLWAEKALTALREEAADHGTVQIR